MSILQQLIEWDKELLLFLNSMHTPFGDKFMWVYTEIHMDTFDIISSICPIQKKLERSSIGLCSSRNNHYMLRPVRLYFV